MMAVALRGLAGRKVRATLTALAIILGVAMVSGTYVLTDTIEKAFSNIFQETYANTDAVVQGGGTEIDFQGESSETPPIPADLLDQVRAQPSVAEAAGSIVNMRDADILKKDGDVVETGGAPSFGFGIDPSAERFNPLKLLEGRWPAEDGEVVLDVGTADDEGYKVGESVRIGTLEPVQAFKIVGLAQYGETESLGAATFAAFTIPEAQRLFHREGELDAISVGAKDGISSDQLVSELKDALPKNVAVRSGTQQADEDAEQGEFVNFIRYFLLSFAGIALFVGAFVIFNTLSITVAQRTREFATLRTLGASRRQVLWSVVLEALVIGFLASVIGLFAGLGLAAGLNALLKSFGGDLPSTGTVFATRTIVVSLLIGTLITLVAGLFPAIRATRVPPISAVREGATLPSSRFARFSPYVGGLVIALAVLLLAYAMFVDDLATFERLISIAVGVLLLFIGVAMLSSRTVRPLAVATNPIARWALVAASVLSYPVTLALWLVRYGLYGSDRPAGKRAQALAAGALMLGAIVVLIALATGFAFALTIAFLVVLTFLVLWALRAAGRFQPEWPLEFPNVRPEGSASNLARENSRRNPGRTASTAAALMIGLALVTFIAVLANGMKASNRGAIEDQVHSDYLLTSEDGFTPFVAGAGDALEGARGTDVVTPVRSDLAKVAGESGYLTGIEPETIAQAYTFEWKEGSNDVLRSLGRDGAVVAKDFADEHDLRVGSPMSLLVPSGERMRLVVKGIYEPPPFFPILGAVSIPKATFDTLYERPRNQYVFVNVPGEPNETSTRMLEKLVADFPDAKVQTQEQWIDQQDEDFNDFLMFLYALLALAVIVSLFGMVNTLVLSIYERTRELGMLRAVGMTRRQVRRMIRQESVVTALIGAALAIPLGILLAVLVTRALSQFDIEFAIPWAQLAIFAAIAIVVGIFAAIAPARRAARLNVLQALQYE